MSKELTIEDLSSEEAVLAKKAISAIRISTVAINATHPSGVDIDNMGRITGPLAAAIFSKL